MANGKGSKRRNEDAAAVRANWDRVFGAKTTPGCPVTWGEDCGGARFHHPPNPHHCVFFAGHEGGCQCGDGCWERKP